LDETPLGVLSGSPSSQEAAVRQAAVAPANVRNCGE
jgi:hypothetical protein